MSKNHKQNHSFRTLDLILLMALVGVISTIAGSIVSEAFHDDHLIQAQASVEILALQLASTESGRPELSANLLSGSTRAPASAQSNTVSQIGKDPWGRPYQYQVIKQAQAVLVVVWSRGGNGNLDTPASDLSASRAASGPLQLKGDDVGYAFRSP